MLEAIGLALMLALQEPQEQQDEKTLQVYEAIEVTGWTPARASRRAGSIRS